MDIHDRLLPSSNRHQVALVATVADAYHHASRITHHASRITNRTKGHPTVNVTTMDSLVADARESGLNFHEFLRRDAMSVATYLLPAGGKDDQVPHREDEIYVIHKGSGKIRIADEAFDVGPGSIIFVAANVAHHFFDYVEDLEIFVLFAPAYTGRG